MLHSSLSLEEIVGLRGLFTKHCKKWSGLVWLKSNFLAAVMEDIHDCAIAPLVVFVVGNDACDFADREAAPSDEKYLLGEHPFGEGRIGR